MTAGREDSQLELETSVAGFDSGNRHSGVDEMEPRLCVCLAFGDAVAIRVGGGRVVVRAVARLDMSR